MLFSNRMKDYYKILGVEKSANEEEIKRAYRKLAHQYHPDRSGGDDKKFKEINEAYQVLSNREKRGYYDRFGSAPQGSGGAPGGGPFGGFDFNGGPEGFNFGFGFDPSQMGDMGSVGDIFETIFEGLGVKRRKTYQRGADLETAEEITLEDAHRGITKNLAIRMYVLCEKCRGAGHDPNAESVKCVTCDGRGEIRENRSSFFGSFSQVRPCAKCFGTGQIYKKSCPTCSGAGRVNGDRKVEVVIATGISDGQIIKISGAGESGERGAGAGDLYVRIRVKPHSIFKREGNDLVAKVSMDIVDVLLGKPVSLVTISGKKIEVLIPADFSLKNKLKVVGEGMPRLGGFGKGDLYIDLDIKTPKHLSAAAKKLLEELSKVT